MRKLLFLGECDVHRLCHISSVAIAIVVTIRILRRCNDATASDQRGSYYK